MHRSGGSRRSKGRKGGSSILRLFAGPVGIGAVVIGLILAVGVWGKDAEPALKPAESAQSKPAAEQPKPVTSVPVQASPTPEQPKPAVPDNSEILQKRRRLDRSGGAAKTMLTTVYYADGLKENASLQPVEVRIPLTTSIVLAISEQVVAAPADLKLYSNVPAGTKVKSVNLDRKTGVATVDLSPEAAGVQGSEAAQNMRASFVYSLTELKDVKAVQLWVNGRPAMLHGIEWSEPLTRAKLEERSTYKIEPVVKFAP